MGLTEIKKTIEILKKERKFKNQAEIATHLGYNPSYFSRALNSGEIPFELEEKFFEEFPKKEFLYKGIDEFFWKDIPEETPKENPDVASVMNRLFQVTNSKPVDSVSSVAEDDYSWVEFQDLSVAAGVMGGANPDVLPDTKRRYIRNEFEKGNYLVVRVDGDSMDNGGKESIPDGCEILIREFIPNGAIPIRNNLFVIVTREGTVLKQIVKHDITTDSLVLHSYNPKYSDYEVQMDDVLQLFIFRRITNYRPIVPDNYLK
ncbi:S24 family peptidase [Cruoricaptor ignavus]|nr:S24 family peptidase [Cruoricaptor ignavus]